MEPSNYKDMFRLYLANNEIENAKSLLKTITTGSYREVGLYYHILNEIRFKATSIEPFDWQYFLKLVTEKVSKDDLKKFLSDIHNSIDYNEKLRSSYEGISISILKSKMENSNFVKELQDLILRQENMIEMNKRSLNILYDMKKYIDELKRSDPIRFDYY